MNKFFFLFTGTLIPIFFFLLPFHAFLVTFLNASFFDGNAAPPSILSVWKEIFLVIFFFCTSFFLGYNTKKIIKKIDLLDILIICFSILSVLIGLWKTEGGIYQLILGIKYNLFFLCLFFVFRHIPISKKFFKRSILFFIIAGLIVSIFGLLQKILPDNLLVSFGYLADHSTFSSDKPLSYCQYVESTSICRLQSFLAGPNRLAALMVFLSAFFWAPLIFRKKMFNISPKISAIFLTITLTTLFFTFSRSGWIAEIVLISLFVILKLKKTFSNKQIFIGGGIFCALLSILVLIGLSQFSDVLIRKGSTSEHWQGVVMSIESLKQNPEGIGIGMAGAASTFLPVEKKFLNENWYLQIFTETGIIGGVIFLWICFLILKKGIKKIREKKWTEKEIPVFFVFISLCVMGLFTHVWETASVAYILWAFLGYLFRYNK